MAEPTIIQGDNFQLCRIRFAHRPEDQMGYRRIDGEPWTVLGDPDDAVFALYLSAVTRLVNISGPQGYGAGWQEEVYPKGVPNFLTGGVLTADSRILSIFPGYPFRSGNIAIPGLKTYGTSYQIVRSGLSGRMSIELSWEGADAVIPFILGYIDPANPVWENMVPVDGDSSEHSKGVNYGRAW